MGAYDELLDPPPLGGAWGGLPWSGWRGAFGWHPDDALPQGPADDSRSDSGDAPITLAAAKHPVARTPDERAQAIYGETSGLYPHSLDPKKSPYDPDNWEEGSPDQLELARRYVGIIAGRNPVTQWTRANQRNPIESRAWNDALDAANWAHANQGRLDSRIKQFYIRGSGDTAVAFPRQNVRRYLMIGPFRNVGGAKSAPAGNDTYIEFYGPP